MLHQIAAINGENDAVQVLTAGHKEDRGRHIEVGADSPAADVLDGGPGVLVEGALAVDAGGGGGDLGGKDAGGDGVDADVQAEAGDVGGEHLGDVDGGRLGGVGGEVVERGADQAVDAADVDDAALGARVVRPGAAGEEGEEGGGDEVVRGRVGAVDGRPVLERGAGRVEEVRSRLLRVLAEGRLRRAVDARVVDQDMQRLLSRFDFLSQASVEDEETWLEIAVSHLFPHEQTKTAQGTPGEGGGGFLLLSPHPLALHHRPPDQRLASLAWEVGS